jgi:hypothetical protein
VDVEVLTEQPWATAHASAQADRKPSDLFNDMGVAPRRDRHKTAAIARAR